MNADLLRFYRKEGPNSDGDWLGQILLWDDTEWEYGHSFIQWVFPTAELSMFNPDAPLLDQETIDEWSRDPLLQHNLRQSYECWLRFCGVANMQVADRKKNVWGRFNHNRLRMTRVLISLCLLGMRKEAEQFYELIVREIGANEHWSKAINGGGVYGSFDRSCGT